MSVVTMTPKNHPHGLGMPHGCGRRECQGFLGEAVASGATTGWNLLVTFKHRVVLSGGCHHTGARRGRDRSGNSGWKASLVVKMKAWSSACSWVIECVSSGPDRIKPGVEGEEKGKD